jgi:uncharacterized protein
VDLVPLKLVAVRIDQATNNPVVLLSLDDAESVSVPDRRVILPIFIGVTEAQAIRIGLEGRATPRPMTHDLLAAVIGATDHNIARVVITHMTENIFYADVVLQKGVEERTVSARPSDAIALAVRSGSPLFATRALFETHALPDPDAEAESGDPDELLDEFRQFLDDINPDDFNS